MALKELTVYLGRVSSCLSSFLELPGGKQPVKVLSYQGFSPWQIAPPRQCKSQLKVTELSTDKGHHSLLIYSCQ